MGDPALVADPPASSAVTAIEILHLRHNLGHQRAIAIGMVLLEDRADADVVVVMDGDGEDLPSDVNRLLDTSNPGTWCSPSAGGGPRASS